MKCRVLLAGALALALLSCAKKHPSAPVAVVAPAPTANTPATAVQLLQWTIVNQDAAAYSNLLTDDYAFVFAANDSAGNGFPDRHMDRAHEVVAMQHMLVGGGAIPPASSITLAIDNPLVVQIDSSPGMNPRWHRVIRTGLNLKITSGTGGGVAATSVLGGALFYVVRGDSAFFLSERAAERDSTLWFISRWEDQTAGSMYAPGLHADPAHSLTLGGVKVRYLDPFPAAPAR